jgi:hypothetical protein
MESYEKPISQQFQDLELPDVTVHVCLYPHDSGALLHAG